MTTNRDRKIAAEMARKAAEIIQEKGKATDILEDEQGRVCTYGALHQAYAALGYNKAASDMVKFGMLQHPDIQAYEATGEAPWCRVLSSWSDLPTTTEAVIAKTFLQVADEIEVSDD